MAANRLESNRCAAPRLTALLIGGVMAAQPYAPRLETAPAARLSPPVTEALIEAVTRPYDDLFDQASRLEFSATQVERMRAFFHESEKFCTGRFHSRAKEQDREIRQAQAELARRGAKLSTAERSNLQCRIRNARLLKAQDDMLASKAIPIAYQNRLAKLDLIQHWPAELERIRADIAAGRHLTREHGDVLDIGFREIARGQESDIKRGQEAIDELKRQGVLPRELDDRQIRAYAESLAANVAAHSDLRVPVKVFVLDSPEVNAFALPGGFLFLQTGLLDAVEDEAQLVGVIAHEISHAAARHGHKLMRRATAAAILYQAAQMAAIILTGGVAGIGAYYALQYGFYGLGLILNLELLGVSREFEIEADQLGLQYAWNAGYDPSGFVRFFDRMASREGYAQGVSWFRTHPPFFERMVRSRSETMYLPARTELAVTTTEFLAMKKQLAAALGQSKRESSRKPTLGLPEADCPKPKLPALEPGGRIETLCEIKP